MNIKYLRKQESISKHRDAILQAQVLGVDTETTGLDAISDNLRLLQISTSPTQVYVFDLFSIDPASDEFDFLRDIFADSKRVKMFHNAKFDIRFLKQKFKAKQFESVYDTFLASQLIACGDGTQRNNLKAACARYAQIDIDKSKQKSDFSRDISDDQVRYAATDALVLHALRDAENKYLRALNLERVATLEFDAVETIADIENAGFYLNDMQWFERCEKDELALREAADKLHAHFLAVSKQQSFFGQSDVNLDSPDQVGDALRALGIPVEDSTLEWKIKQFAKEYPVIDDLLTYRGLSTSQKTFGKDYLKFIHVDTRRIHAEFKQLGTPTGRTTCSDPNLQQLPREGDYRACFQPQRSNRRFIVADYSQIELRIMAQFSRDEKLLQAYRDDIDLHAFTASQVFKKTLDAVGKGTPERHTGKGLNFGTAFGIGKYRFAQNSGLSVSESESALKAYWNVYQGLDRYLQQKGQEAVDELESHSHSGRTWRFDYDKEDRNAMSEVNRLGRNFSIQATCSDILKRALYFLRRELKPHATADLVNIVHDEMIVECDESDAQDVLPATMRAMTRAGEEVITEVPVKVDAKITTAWEK